MSAVRTAIFLVLSTTLPAVQSGPAYIAVDRPADWYRYDVSHHGKHGAGGAILGAGLYLGCRSVTDRRTAAWSAWGGATAVGIAYELERCPSGSWVDPVDMAWTSAGAAVSVLLTYSADRFVVSPLINRNEAGVALAWRF